MSDDEPLGWFEPGGAATLRAAWEDSPALVSVTLGANHVLTYQNEACRAAFGHKVGHRVAEVFPELGTDQLAPLDEVVRTGQTLVFRQRLLRVPRLDGGPMVLSFTLSPLRTGGAEPGVVMQALDVTAEVQAAQAAERARILADVSAAVAGAPSAAAGLQAFTDALVPELAEFAAVYVLAETAVEPLPPAVTSLSPALAHVGPPPPPEARDTPSPWRAVLRSGQPIVIPVDPSRPGEVTPSRAGASWLRAVGATSIAVVPLVVAGELTGGVLLLSGPDRQPYQEADLPFLSDLAARVGVAMVQQLTQRRQRETAAQLQRVLLPPKPPQPPGLAIAARYVAGGPDAQVGGDWWDVQELDQVRVAFGIGDVAGRGVAAAAVMGQARAAMRAASRAQLTPAQVLEVLDGQLAELLAPDEAGAPAPPRFATSCYGVVDRAEGRLRVANAGHLPLLLRTASGEVRIVELPPGAPLGMRVGGFTTVDLPFTAGDVVAVCTDGLVESREVELDAGLSALADALHRFGGDPDLDLAVKQILQVMSEQPGYGDDDVALLLVRVVGESR